MRRPFTDLGEVRHVITLLESDAEAPLDVALHWCRRDNLLRRELRWLSEQVVQQERAHGVTPGSSEPSAILLRLEFELLPNCRDSARLGAMLPELRELLLSAYAVQCDLESDRLMVQLSDQDSRLNKWEVEGRIRGGESRKGKLSPFNHAITRLAQALRSVDRQRILEELRADAAGDRDESESELLNDLRAARSDPVLIRFDDVPTDLKDRKAKIGFRNVMTRKEGSKSVSHLLNLLPKIDLNSR